jgi:hypothetical protein
MGAYIDDRRDSTFWRAPIPGSVRLLLPKPAHSAAGPTTISVIVVVYSVANVLWLPSADHPAVGPFGLVHFHPGNPGHGFGPLTLVPCIVLGSFPPMSMWDLYVGFSLHLSYS